MNIQNEPQTPITPVQDGRSTSTLFQERSNSTNFRDIKLQVLVQLAINTLRDRGVAFHTSVPQAPKAPDIFDNAKFEQMACAGLQPKFNGSPDELIPTLNAIHIRRQNQVWYAAPFLIQDGTPIDLVRNFSQVRQETVQQKAAELWDTADSITL
jgi:hypothetical protein